MEERYAADWVAETVEVGEFSPPLVIPSKKHEVLREMEPRFLLPQTKLGSVSRGAARRCR